MPKQTGTPVSAASSATPEVREFFYSLAEDQHHKLYQARHLCETLLSLSNSHEEFVDVRRESLATTLNLILELFDQSGLNLVWRQRHVQ